MGIELREWGGVVRTPLGQLLAISGSQTAACLGPPGPIPGHVDEILLCDLGDGTLSLGTERWTHVMGPSPISSHPRGYIVSESQRATLFPTAQPN